MMWRYPLFLFTCFTLLSGCGKRSIPAAPKPPAVVDGEILDQMCRVFILKIIITKMHN